MALSENQIDHSGNSNTSMEQLFLANEKDLYIASRSLKAMGHPLRLKILCILAEGIETSVQDLVDLVGTSQSNISQHLSILRDKGILASRKDANKVYYRIGDDKILALMETMREAFAAPTDRLNQPGRKANDRPSRHLPEVDYRSLSSSDPFSWI